MLTTDEPTPCSIDPALWFSADPADQAEAKVRCQSCNVMLRCLTEALETEALMGQPLAGIHGALDQRQRARTTLKLIG